MCETNMPFPYLETEDNQQLYAHISSARSSRPTHHTTTVQEPDDDDEPDISLCWRCVGEIPAPGGSVENSEIGDA
jgi:hypothetical protein